MNNLFFLKIINKIKNLKSSNSYKSIQINHKKFIIPVFNNLGDWVYGKNQPHEPWLDGIIKNILSNRPGAFIDIGVNLGQTLLKVKSLNLSNEYFGFEPNPTCCYYANELVRLNKFNNCTIVPVGLYDKPALLKLLMKSDEDPAASLIEDFRDPSYSYSLAKYVPVFTGDYLLNLLNIGEILLIKIDVEGAELEVISGLRDTLKKSQPYIICEILPLYDENTKMGQFRKNRQDAIANILAQENYQIYRIIHSGELMALETIEIHSDLSLCEYLFIPKAAPVPNKSL
jgi:FkbM family methyltransferase